jgi:hypothetical protein
MRLGPPLLVYGLYFPQPAEKTGIGDQVARPAMVGMTVFPRIPQHDFGAVFPDGPDQPALMVFIITEKAIRHTQVLPDIQLQDGSRPCSLLGPQFRRSSRSQFSPGEVHHSCPLAVQLFHEKGPGTTQFHIVRMHRYR